MVVAILLFAVVAWRFNLSLTSIIIFVSVFAGVSIGMAAGRRTLASGYTALPGDGQEPSRRTGSEAPGCDH